MARSRCLCWLMSSGIFLAAMLLYHVNWNPNGRLANTAYESLELGNSIALNGTFSDPFAPLPTGPSAHVGPGYPALVALIIRMFGSGPNGNFALGLITKTVVAAQLAMFPFLAEYLGLRCWTGAIAGTAWLVAGFPLERWESDFAGLLIVILAFHRTQQTQLTTSSNLLVPAGVSDCPRDSFSGPPFTSEGGTKSGMSFGSAASLHCTAPAGTWFAGQAVRNEAALDSFHSRTNSSGERSPSALCGRTWLYKRASQNPCDRK